MGNSVQKEIKRGLTFTDAENQKYKILVHSIQNTKCKVLTEGGQIIMADREIEQLLNNKSLCLAMVVDHAAGTAGWTILDTGYSYQRQVGPHDSIYPMKELKNILSLEGIKVYGV